MVVLGALAAILIIGAAVSFVASRHDGPHYPKTWDARILPIVHFDEQERGLTFKHPVEVDFMSPKAFEKTVTSSSGTQSAKQEAQLNDQTASFRAIGLLEGKVDLFKQENGLSGSGILAYYSYDDKKVRVKGTELTPDVRVTLAHELTHALQDQYFDLKRLDNLPDDAQDAFRSVVEGDAVTVQDAYAQTMSKADQQSYDQAENQGSQSAYSAVPPVLVAYFQSPYIVGPAFVQAIKARGGNEAIDQAIKNPPPNTATLMNIFQYLDQASSSTTPSTLADPPLASGDKRLDGGNFGALTWYLMLARRLDVHQALKAVDGWGADSSLIYKEKSGRVCVDARYQGRTPADTTTMAGILDQWKAAGPDTGATVTSSGRTVTVTSCDPGTSVKLTGTDRSDDALELVAGRIQIAQAMFEQHFPTSTAQCTVDGVMDRLTLDDMVSTDPAVEQKATSALEAAVAACH
jgi:hypothetical protein